MSSSKVAEVSKSMGKEERKLSEYSQLSNDEDESTWILTESGSYRSHESHLEQPNQIGSNKPLRRLMVYSFKHKILFLVGIISMAIS